ncbi:MAG TPA: hypothetical protein VFL98_00545 [Candidatus Paceibacterota bacterium]|nr:hypothetical protein [Candidatus Paceibacterota bacterium]
MRMRILQAVLIVIALAIVGGASFALKGSGGAAVTVNDSYEGGIHHVRGTVPVPPSCAGVAVSATVVDGTAHLAFTPDYAPGANGACTTVTAPRPYETSFSGAPARAYEATVEGQPVPVRIISS